MNAVARIRKQWVLSMLMLAMTGFGYAHCDAQALTAPASSLLRSSPVKATPPAAMGAKNKPTIEVKPLVVKANEFPAVILGQMKVAFECTILHTPPQTRFDVFPRYRCDLDKPRTVEINPLTIQRVDQFPSVDGITTKVVVIAHKPSKDAATPPRLRAAFQLYRDQSAGNSVALLKDFLYADAMF